MGSSLACIVDAADRNTGEVRMTRVILAANCGRVVDPDTLVSQIQGGVVSGINAILYSQVIFANGCAERRNFNTNRMLRIDEMPTIETQVLPSSENSGGIGESGAVVV